MHVPQIQTNKQKIIMPPQGIIKPRVKSGIIPLNNGISPRVMAAMRGSGRGVMRGVANRGGVAASPIEDLANLTSWCSARDADISEASGAVSQWNDRSGNGNHYSQATPANKPSYTSGQGYVSFDGSDDALVANFASMYNSTNSGGTFMAVIEMQSSSNTDTLAAETNSAGSAYYSIARVRGDQYPSPQTGDDAGVIVFNDSQFFTTSLFGSGFCVYYQTVETSAFRARIDNTISGTRTYSRTGHTLTLDETVIGARGSGDRAMHVDVYDFFTCDDLLTEDEITAVHSYYASEYGV